MFVAVALYERFPFFGICRHDEQGVALAKLGKFVCHGIDEAFVAVFDCIDFRHELLVLKSPISAVFFKVTDVVLFLKTRDIGRIDVHAFHDRDSLLFLLSDVKCHFTLSFSSIF